MLGTYPVSASPLSSLGSIVFCIIDDTVSVGDAKSFTGTNINAETVSNAEGQSYVGTAVIADTVSASDPPTSYANDTFTDANGTVLTSHTPDSGPSWSIQSNPSQWTIQS